jgi:putative ABC transport system permease protein
MFTNFIKVSIRNLFKHKFYGSINIAGLTIGIASTIFILLYVQDELSFDKQFAGYERIYRVNLIGRIQNEDLKMSVSCAPMAAALVADYPEVEHSTRVNALVGEPLIRYKENSLIEKNYMMADSTFFDLFKWPLIQGNASTALNRKNTVVLSERIAKKYFGNEDPVGKMIEIGDARDKFEVTGIMKNWPANSHLNPEIISSFLTDDYSRNQNWISNNIYTYVLLREGTTQLQFESKLRGLIQKYVGPQMEKIIGADLKSFEKAGNKWGYSLIPLTDIHLHSIYTGELKPTGNYSSIYIFSIVAILIILIACINFMNMSTAKSSLRAKEVALRKILGSLRGNIMVQFIIESIFLAIISLFLALLLVEVLMPLFNQIAGKEISLILTNPLTYVIFLGIGLVVGLLAGSYPAFFLSSFEPVRIFRGEIVKGRSRLTLRGILVIVQLTVTIGLFISTIVIARQIKYVQLKKLGFEKDNVLVIQRTPSLGTNAGVFKQELLKIPEIKTASFISALPGQLYGTEAYTLEGLGPAGTRAYRNMSADEDFQQTLKLEMVAGRWFSKDMPTDTNSIVVNEALVKAAGLKDPVGKSLQRMLGPQDWITQRIVGVVKDFHTESLHKSITPLVIWFSVYHNSLAVRINSGNPLNVIEKIRTLWEKFQPAQPMNYTFFSDDWLTLYKNEQRSKSLFTIFSILSILIAALGLLGIAAFIAEKRTKEIGIRKVLGASIPSVLRLMTREIYVYTGIATVLSWIISYYFMREWLNNFYYRVNLSAWTFIFSSALALLIAIITVGSISFFAAKSDPIKSIRYE